MPLPYIRNWPSCWSLPLSHLHTSPAVVERPSPHPSAQFTLPTVHPHFVRRIASGGARIFLSRSPKIQGGLHGWPRDPHHPDTVTGSARVPQVPQVDAGGGGSELQDPPVGRRPCVQRGDVPPTRSSNVLISKVVKTGVLGIMQI